MVREVVLALLAGKRPDQFANAIPWAADRPLGGIAEQGKPPLILGICQEFVAPGSTCQGSPRAGDLLAVGGWLPVSVFECR
jgi:hypothetical protein